MSGPQNILEIPHTVDIVSVTTNSNKFLYLPATASIYGKTITVKDITGNAKLSNITLYTQGPDRFQDGISSNYIIDTNFGYVSFFAKRNIWYILTETIINSGGGGDNIDFKGRYGEFSTLSTNNILVGYVDSPLEVDVGVVTPFIVTSNISGGRGYFADGIGIGKEVPYWYALDISGNARITSIETNSIVADNFIGDGSLLRNVGASTHLGVSSLSSIISYGFSTIADGAKNPGVSSLSSIISYGLSTVAAQPQYGVSSLSSIVSYGLSTVAGQPQYGVSSLSSIVSYGLSTVAAQPQYGVSSLSSIVSYGLSTVAAQPQYGVSSLSSILSYGLSSLRSESGPGQPHYGVSSLSSIVSYGLSSLRGSLITNSNITSNWALYPAIQDVDIGYYNIKNISNMDISGNITIDGDIYTDGNIHVFGDISINSNIYATYFIGDGSQLTGIKESGIDGISSLSSIVSYGLSSLYSPDGISSLSSIVSYGLSSLYSPDGVSSLSSIVSYGLSSLYSPDGVSSLSSIVSYGLSSLYSPDGISSLSSIVSYGLSSLYSPDGVSSLSSIVSYGLSSLYSPDGVSSLSSIVSYGLSSLYSPDGVSSLSSIVSYGLSTLAYGLSNLEYTVSQLENAQLLDTIQLGLSSVVASNLNPINPGVSSLSSIVSYGLSTLAYSLSNLEYTVSQLENAQLLNTLELGLSSIYSPYGISSLSSIVSYGLSTVAAQPQYGVSSLSSIVSYGLSTVAAQPQYGVSSLSSIVSYGLSTVAAQPQYGVSSLSSIVSYGLSTVAAQPQYGVSSLSSIVSYGLSTVAAQPQYGVSSLSSIVSYGLSTVAAQPQYGVSSLSSIVSYGLSTVAAQPQYGVSSLSSIVSYGLSTVARQPQYGVSSLSSILSYGLSSLRSESGPGQPHYGVSSLSSIVSYGLSSLRSESGPAQPHYGVSSLSSIVSYGLSSLRGSLITNSNITSNWALYPAIQDVDIRFNDIKNVSNIDVSGNLIIDGYISIDGNIYANSNIYATYFIGDGSQLTGISYEMNWATYIAIQDVDIGYCNIKNISNMDVSGNITIDGDIYTDGNIHVFGDISTNSNIYATYFIGDGSRLTGIKESGIDGISSLSSIVSYGLSSLYSPDGISSLSSIVSYGLSTINYHLEPDISFHDLNSGGTGIVAELTQNNNDTYTTGLSKIDNWLYRNIIDQPPQPTFNFTSRNTSNITVSWNLPYQFQIGMLGPNMFIPFIQSVSMIITDCNNRILSNIVNTSNYLPRYTNNVNNIYSQSIIGCNINTLSITQNPIVITPSIVNRTLRITLLDTQFSATFAPFKVDIYYSNYSSNRNNIYTFSGLNFQGADKPPSAPRNTYLTNTNISNMIINIQNPIFANEIQKIEPRSGNPLSNYYITIETVNNYQRRRFPFHLNNGLNTTTYNICNIVNKETNNASQLINLCNLDADTLYRIYIGADNQGNPHNPVNPIQYTTDSTIGPCNIVVSQQLITDIRSNGPNSVLYTFDSFSYYPAFNTNQFVTVTGVGSNYRSSRFNISNVRITSATTSNFTVGCNIEGSACNYDLVPYSELRFTITNAQSVSGGITYTTLGNHQFTSNQFITIRGIGYTAIDSSSFIGVNSRFNVENALIISCNNTTFTVACNATGTAASDTMNRSTSNLQVSNITITNARSNTGTRTVTYTTLTNHNFTNNDSITIAGIGTFYSCNFNISNRLGFTAQGTNLTFTSNISGFACNLDLIAYCNYQFSITGAFSNTNTTTLTYNSVNNFRLNQRVTISGIDVGNWYRASNYNISNARILSATPTTFTISNTCNLRGTACNFWFTTNYTNIVTQILNPTTFVSSNHNFTSNQVITLIESFRDLNNSYTIISCNRHTITVNSNIGAILSNIIGNTSLPYTFNSDQVGQATTQLNNAPIASVIITNAPQAFVTIANNPTATVILSNNPIATVPVVNTLLPIQPPPFSNLTSNFSRGLYNSVNRGVGEPIFNANGRLISSIFNNSLNPEIRFITNTFAIHSSNNTGLSNTNSPTLALFSFRCVSNTTITPNNYEIKSYFGQDLGISFGLTGVSNYNDRVIIHGIYADPYSNSPKQSNFYQTIQLCNIIVTSNYLQPSSNPYTFSAFYSNSFYNNCNIFINYSNYVDTINAAPSLDLVSNYAASSSLYITGVPTYSYNTILSNIIDIRNLAKYFFVGNQNLLVARYSNANIAVIPGTCNYPSSNTDLYSNTQITPNSLVRLNTVPLPDITRIFTVISINCNTLYTNASINTPQFTIYTQLCNLFAQRNINCNMPLYFDARSQILIETIINNSNNSNGGIRMESGINNLDPGANINDLSRITYNNQRIIRGGPETTYLRELPIINGLFHSASNLGNLYDFINLYRNPNELENNTLTSYSGIKNDNTTRYATFKYSLSNSAGTGSNIYKFRFRLIGGTGFNSNSDRTYNNAVQHLQYRVDTAAPGQCNSRWINGNSIRTDGEGGAGVTPLVFNAENGLRCNTVNTAITLTDRFFSVTPISNTTNYDIYVRIGLNAISNISFSNIQMAPYAGQVPFAPSNLNLVLTNPIRNTTSLVFSWSNPRVIDTELTFDYYQFSIIATQTASRPRRWVPSETNGIQGPLFEPYKNLQYYHRIYLSNTSNFSYSSSFSNYDTPYEATVWFANDVGLGTSSKVTSITPLPVYNNNSFTQTNALEFNLNPAPSNYYFPNTMNIFNFSQRSLGALNNILNYNRLPVTILIDYKGSDTLFSNSYNVNDISQPGGSLSNCFYTTTWSSGSSNITARYNFTNDLYYASDSSSNRTVTSNTLTLGIRKIQDQYSSGQATGFYMNAYANINLSNGFNQMVTNNNGFSNSNIFTLSLCNAVNFNTITSATYWIDNAVGNRPVITNIDVDPTEITNNTGVYSNYVCGVLCFSGTNTNSFYVGVNNLGSYYFMANALVLGLCNITGSIIGTRGCNFPFNNSNTDFYSAASSGAIYTAAPLRNPTYFQWPITFGKSVYTPSNTFGFLNVTACNLYSNSATCNVRYFGFQGSNMFFDDLSINVMKATLTSNYTRNSYGARIESGSNPGPFDGYPNIGIFGNTFNQLCNLNVGSYSNELQLANGAYRTHCNATFNGASNGYLNYTGYYNPYRFNTYADYTTYTKPTFQYLTLKWAVSSGNNDWKSADIKFEYSDPTLKMEFRQSSPNISNINFPNIHILYKIVASNDETPTQTNFTTAWLNANSNIGRAAKPTIINKNIDGFPGGLYSTNDTTNSNIKVYFPEPLTGSSYSNVNFSFYVQIGIPSNSNIEFKYIALELSTSDNNPGRGLELKTEHSNLLGENNRLCNATITWTRANDGISITSWIYRYRALSNLNNDGIEYPRKYDRSNGTRLILPDSNGINDITCNVAIGDIFNRQQFTAFFTPSNYDTYHTVTAYARNGSGTGESNTSVSLNPTALPLNTGNNFGDSLQFVNMNAATYNSLRRGGEGVLFANRSTQIPLTNVFRSQILYNTLFTNNFTVFSSTAPVTGITINPSGNYVGRGLSNVNWIVTLLNMTTDVTIATCNYRFTNTQVYDRTSSNYQVASNSGFIWSNINTSDIYYNGPLNAAGFYGVTTPLIALRSNIAPASINQYSLSLVDENREDVDSTTNSIEFYVDNLNTNPSGRIFLDNSNSIPIGSYCNVCGIPVITTSNFRFWIQASNIGSFFFFPNAASGTFTDSTTPSNVYNYIFDAIDTPFYSTSNTNSQYTTSPISNTTFFYWSNVQLSNTAYGTTFTNPSINLRNIWLNGFIPINTNFTPYFDINSVRLLASNVRVLSGSGLYPDTDEYGDTYNNKLNLLVGPYSNELQIVNGAYRTRSSGGFCNYTSNIVPVVEVAYRNLCNYSVAPTNVFRYATFLFTSNTSNTSNKVDTITFTVNWLSESTPSTGATQNNAYNSNAIQLFTRFGRSEPTTTGEETGWLNMNCNLDVTSISITAKNQDNTACTSIFDNETNTFTIKVPDGVGYNQFNNYVRIGMKMDCNVAFTSITYDRHSEINIPSYFRFTSNFDLASEIFTLTWNLVSGMPTNKYNSLYNTIFKSNPDGSYSIYQNSNMELGPTTSNYQVIRNLFSDTSESTVIYPGTYCNVVNIDNAAGVNIFRSNFVFTIPDYGIDELSNLTITNTTVTPEPTADLAPTTINFTRVSGTNKPPYQGGFISYYALSNSRRHYASGAAFPLSDSNRFNCNAGPYSITENTTYTNTFTPSNYGVTYVAFVSMSNYSRLQPVTSNTNSVLPTPLPSNIGSNFGTSLRNASNVNTYTVSGYIFGSIDYDLINAPQILNCNALFDTDGFSYKFMNFASGVSVSTITVNSGPNTDGSNLSNVKWSVSLSNNTTGTSLWSCNYDFLNTLYGLNSYTNIVSSDTQTNLSISTRDMYSNHPYKSGFYMTATPTIQLNASIIPASSNAYTLTFGTNSLDEARSNTCNFYVDSLLNTTPTGRIFVENTGGITFCNICGRSVITSSKFNFWIDTSNIGRYFIHSNAVTANLSNGWYNFAFDMRTTPFYNNCNILDGSIYTASPISNTTYFYWSNVTITPSYRATFGTTVGDELSLFLSNLNGGSIRIPGNFTPYFDPESVALLSQNVRVTSGRATYGTGTNIVACNNPAPGTFGEPYNNNENIQTNADYTGELLLYNGAYRFLNNLEPRYNQHFGGNNLNPHGSDIITQPTTYGSIINVIRNVTFIFSNINPPNIYSKLSYITLLLTYYNGDSVPSMAAPVGQFYEDANFFIRIGSSIPLTVNDSSGWLNANKCNTSISKSISLSDKILDNTTINCLCNSINEGINHKLTIIIPDGCGYSNMNLYTRYGSFTNNNVALKSIQIFSSNEINIPSYFTVSSNTPSNGNPNDTTTVTFNTNNLGLPSNLYYFQLSNVVYNTIDNTIFTSSNQNMSPLISNYTILNHPSMPPGTYSNYIQIWTNPNLGEPYMFWSSNYILTVSGRAPLRNDFSLSVINNNTLSVGVRVTLTNNNLQPNNNFYYFKVRAFYYNELFPTVMFTPGFYTVSYNLTTTPSDRFIDYDPRFYNCNIALENIFLYIKASNAMGTVENDIRASTGPQCNVDMPSFPSFIAMINYVTGDITFKGAVNEVNLGSLEWNISRSNSGAANFSNFYDVNNKGGSNFTDPGIKFDVPSGELPNFYYDTTYKLYASNTCNVLGWGPPRSNSSDFYLGTPSLPSNFVFNLSNNNTLDVNITPTTDFLGITNYFYYSVSNTSPKKIGSSIDSCNITTPSGLIYPYFDGPYEFGTNVGILHDPEVYGQEFRFYLFGSNILGKVETESNIIAYTGPQCNFDTPVLSNTFNAIINCNSGEITFYGGVAALSNSLGALTWNIYLSNIIFTTYTKLYSDFSYDSNFILNGLSKTVPVGSNSNYYYDSSYQLIASNTSNLRGWITPPEVLRTNNIGGPPLPSNYNVITTNDNSLNVFITPTLINPATLPTYNRFYYTVSNTSNTKRDGTTLAIDVFRSIGASYQSYSGPIEFGDNATIVYDPEIYNQDITFTIYGSNYLGQTDFSNVYAYTGLQCNVDVPTVSDFITTIDCNTGSIQFTGSVTLNNNLGDLKWYIKQQTTTSIDDFLGPYPGQSNNFSISSNIPIGSNILYYYRDSSNINSYGNIITGQYFLFACNTSNAGWVSKENVSCNSIVPFSPFPYIDFNVSEIGNLSVSIRPTLCNPYLGPAGSKFYYFITGGNNILPASYNGPHDMGSIVGISNILGEPEDEFTTNLYQQWGCNIKFHVAISNALYTYDSNFYHLQGSNLQETSNIYTGPQCNGNIPNILDFSANINCNTGKITFSGNVEKVTLGEVEWNISRSNNDTADFINFYYSNKIGASNFMSPGILWDIPDNEPSNFYYNTTYKIFASNNCNVRGWQTDQTYISYNFIIHGAPLPSNFLVTLYNNNSPNVYIIPTLINPSSLPECNSFYYTISNIHLNKRLGSPLACNILTSNKLLQYPDFDGPYPFNTPARILYDIEVYDQDFKFYIYGSNIFGTTSNTLQNNDAYTGPPFDLDTPTITDFSINSIDPNDGTLSISANVSNIGGTLTYYIVYFNKYTDSNIYQPLDYINTPFNGPSNIVDYRYTPFNFLQLYDNIVTIYATNKFDPIVKEFSSSLTTDSYSLATPGLQPIESIYQVNKYIFTTSINNYSYDDIPEITTIWTLLYFSIDENSYIDITNDISESTNSNIQYNFGDANILYVIKAQFSISNAYNLFYGPISRQKITIYDNIDTAEFRLENTGIINASAVYPNGIIYIDCIFYTSDDKVVSGESIPIIININDNEYITVTYNQNEFDNNGETLNRLVFDGTRGLVTDININLTTDNTFKSDYAIITVLYNKES